MEERIYASFFVNGEHFTVEDYDQGYALYCEESFVTKLETPDETAAYKKALEYEAGR